MHRLFQVVALLAGVAAGSGGAIAASLSTPEVDGYNVRVGTQIFGPKYHFTTNTSLVEAAGGILDMGSDVLKFYMGRGFFNQYGATLPSSITNLASMARLEPSCRTVLDLPFRHYAIWSYCFAATGDAWWSNGFPPSEQQAEYNEFYAFAQYLLTNYNNSGTSFYLGHWEALASRGIQPGDEPQPNRHPGMIDRSTRARDR
jgi:hypothetical protein